MPLSMRSFSLASCFWRAWSAVGGLRGGVKVLLPCGKELQPLKVRIPNLSARANTKIRHDIEVQEGQMTSHLSNVVVIMSKKSKGDTANSSRDSRVHPAFSSHSPEVGRCLAAWTRCCVDPQVNSSDIPVINSIDLTNCSIPMISDDLNRNLGFQLWWIVFQHQFFWDYPPGNYHRYPRCSMVLVYLLTFTPKMAQFCR